ncbi:hypothetical protein PV721_16215 [Streptomyces sp. MB09-01]|uniref:hypothetical protein n=1 Tax=Streptomyces sp. MB09-01 TaxID=3028666 RepID=UPI0029BED482|nr:hypothetical protein [Streptomyces sp. MB09-01]MDX3535884.1 hypothetical protein [Streptomyces sp. MB09-01]
MSAAAKGAMAVGSALGLAASLSVDSGSGTRAAGQGNERAVDRLSADDAAIATMSDAERAALWRQRLHEAEAGLTRFLVARGPAADLRAWFGLQAEIFADLPGPSTHAAAAWQRIFFRGQALMERFLVSRYGEGILAEWAASNAEVHRTVEPDREGGAADPVRRIARQAELYGSQYRVHVAEGSTPAAVASVNITHCAIWDYREQARSNGVRLTLTSPCTYCTKAMSANVRAKGYEVSYQLREDRSGHGCHWEATVPNTAQEA